MVDAPISPRESIPILVMNMCISLSINVAERCTSNIGKTNAANAVNKGKNINSKTPAKPANSAPSANPPVKEINRLATIKPSKKDPPI